MLNDKEQNKPICLFDSGIGGLTVLKKLITKFPNENYIYLADLARVPFGDKTKDEIKKIVNEIIEWLVTFKPKIIIMACNTSSALLNHQLSAISHQLSIPIYGMIQSCATEITKSKHKKISVWATKFVAESNVYKKTIQNNNPDITVEETACQKLVPMIEGLSFTLEERNKIINEYLSQTSKDSNALILGCTHYPLISEDLKRLTNIEIIDPADYLINDLCRGLLQQSSTPLHTSTQISLYTTAQKEKLERFSKLYLHLKGDVKVNLINLNKITI